jgi:hypothetical protein
MNAYRSTGGVANYGWVARAVPTSLRSEVLSFQHHKIIAPLPPAQQRKWLDRAAKEVWSSNELKSAIARQAAIDKPRIVVRTGF